MNSRMERTVGSRQARERRRDERGAVLVHVAISLTALLAFGALVVDLGVKWVARGQAQNAADAGALAAAVALSLEDPDDMSDAGPAKQSALAYARANEIWGEQPDVDVTADVTFLGPDMANRCPDDSDDRCVRVDVHRNQARGNPLPTFFAGIVGVTNQGVRATATAQILPPAGPGGAALPRIVLVQ
jgi:Flp pilus assembly protein TadG